MVERFLDRALLESVGNIAVKMSGLSAFILWLPHLMNGTEGPGQGTVGAS